MSQPVRRKRKVPNEIENNAAIEGGGDVGSQFSKPEITDSDSDSPRRIKRHRSKHSSSLLSPTFQHSSKRHHPRKSSSSHVNKAGKKNFANLDKAQKTPGVRTKALKWHYPGGSEAFKNIRILVSCAMLLGFLILLAIIVSIIAAFASRRPFSQTTIISVKSIIRNATVPTDPSPYNQTYWNQIKGECGESKQQPNLITGRIVGGIDAAPHSWPWMVSIVRYWDYDDGYFTMSHLCGGTLIGPDVVITAASCFLTQSSDAIETSPDRLRVIVGGHARLSIEDGAKLVKINEIHIHPHNNLESFISQRRFPNYDVAILILAIKFDPQRELPATGLACLPRPMVIPPVGKRCWVLGWGDLPNPSGLNVLKQIPQGIVSQTTCQEHYSNYISYDKHLCVRERYIGACEGDLGGPLVCQGDDRKWTLYGAVSYTPGTCISGPSVYTSIAMIVEWICCATKDVAICSAVPCKVN